MGQQKFPHQSRVLDGNTEGMSIQDMRRLNQKRPAVDLPAEVLLRIFRLVVPEDEWKKDFEYRWEERCGRYGGGKRWEDPDYLSSPEESKKKPHLHKELYKLTHVCHYWRAVASSAAGLWTIVWLSGSKKSQALAKENLRRLGSPSRIPFGIMVQTSTEVKPEQDPMAVLADVVPTGLDRVKTMHLCLAYPGPDIALLHKPAEQLDSLSIIALKNGFFTFPRKPFAGRSSNLRSVSLANLFLPVTLTVPGSITHLSLGGILFVASPQDESTSRNIVDVLCLVRILRECSSLEDLELENVGPGISKLSAKQVAVDPIFPVTFAFLRSVQLSEFLDPRTPYTFLNAIRAPSLSYIGITHRSPFVSERKGIVPDHIRFNEEASSANAARIYVDTECRVLDIHLRSYRGWDRIHLDSPDTDWWLEIGLRGGCSCVPYDNNYEVVDSHGFKYDQATRANQEVYSRTFNDGEIIVQASMSFIKHWIPQDIQMLTVDYADSAFRDFSYEELLRHFDKLRCLEIRDFSTSIECFHLFPTLLEDLAERSGSSIPLPNLEALMLGNMILDDARSSTFKHLCFFLEKRKTLLKPLAYISLFHSNVDEEVIKILRTLVLNVSYDGKGVYECEGEEDCMDHAPKTVLPCDCGDKECLSCTAREKAKALPALGIRTSAQRNKK